MFSVKELQKYYKKKGLIDETIEQRLREDADLILYGGKAVNMHLPKYLQRETEDWDIYSDDNPEHDAKELEGLLDKRFGIDYFSVVPSRHEGTYVIRSKVTGQGVADITLKRTDIKHKKVAGIDITTLEYQAKRMRATLKDPTKKHRWDKDRDTLQRIAVFQATKGPTVEVVPIPKAKNWAKQPNRLDIRGVNPRGRSRVVPGVAYADRKQNRLSRIRHKGFKRIKYT